WLAAVARLQTRPNPALPYKCAIRSGIGARDESLFGRLHWIDLFQDRQVLAQQGSVMAVEKRCVRVRDEMLGGVGPRQERDIIVTLLLKKVVRIARQQVTVNDRIYRLEKLRPGDEDVTEETFCRQSTHFRRGVDSTLCHVPRSAPLSRPEG